MQILFFSRGLKARLFGRGMFCFYSSGIFFRRFNTVSPGHLLFDSKGQISEDCDLLGIMSKGYVTTFGQKTTSIQTRGPTELTKPSS